VSLDVETAHAMRRWNIVLVTTPTRALGVQGFPQMMAAGLRR